MAGKKIFQDETLKPEKYEPKIVTVGGGSKVIKEPRAKDKYKLVAFYLEPAQNKALENLKNRLIQNDQGRDKSDLVREAINDLLTKYKELIY